VNASDAGRTSSYYRYRFGTVEFDEAKKELRVGGLPIEIERRPLQVLEYLLQHIGETVTKEELLREVWENRTPTEQTLTNAIVKLRRALGEANEQYIVNQARIGYRIAGPVERAAVGRRLASQISLAADEPVPQRPNFRLKRILGSTKGSEVWLAEHAKTSDLRVYKFATHSDRLSGLKREATLSRLLHESLGPRPDIAQVIDWNFVEPPFFLECAYGGQNLVEWNKGDAPLARCTVQQRIELFLQIARAVAAAHGVGVLHKDIKPANVLVKGHEGAWQLQLTDFGSSRLLEPDRLAEYGITQLGLTITQQNLGGDSTTGTPLYIAPELLKGQTPTVLSDVYSLGVMLYQFLIADFGSPMASGWERGIEDELLRDDIRQATDGEPIQRIASVAELVSRLENIPQRLQYLIAAEQAKQQARQEAQRIQKAQTRRPFVIASVIGLIVGLTTVTSFYLSERNARRTAILELKRADAINEFLNTDLVTKANPAVFSKGKDTLIKDALISASTRIGTQFSEQPDVEAPLRIGLCTMFNRIDMFDEAEEQCRRAIQVMEGEQGAAKVSVDMLKARSLLSRVLSRNSKFAESGNQISAAKALYKELKGKHAIFIYAAESSHYLNQGLFKEALEPTRLVVEGYPSNVLGDQQLLSGYRTNLIQIYSAVGDTSKAIALAEKFLKDAESNKESSASRSLAMYSLAFSLIPNGEYERAKNLLESAQDLLGKDLPEGHTFRLQSLNLLLDIAVRSNDSEKAVLLSDRLVFEVKSKYGSNHLFSGLALVNRGIASFSLGLYTDARKSLEEGLQIYSKIVPNDNPQAQLGRFWLAATLIEFGNFSSSEEIISTLNATQLEALIAEEPWEAKIIALKGFCLIGRKQRERGLALLEEARPLLEKHTSDTVLLEKLITTVNSTAK